jgi:hypothetical protein
MVDARLSRFLPILINVNVLAISQLLNEVINFGFVYTVVFLPSLPGMMRML